MKRLAAILVALALLTIAGDAAAEQAVRDPDQPPRIAAKAGDVRQKTRFHKSAWRYPQGDELCVVQLSEGVPSDRARPIDPGRTRTRVNLYTRRKPDLVRLATYSRRIGPGDYGGRSRPEFALRRFRDQAGRPGWRIVFIQRVGDRGLLRGEVLVRWPDDDGCGPDRGYAAFTFRARR